MTLSEGNRAAARPRIDLLVERGMVEAPVPECDLVVHGVIAGNQRGWAMGRDGLFAPDRAAEPAISLDALEALTTGPGQSLTFMCTPWGSGTRIGIDRDLDGILDGDE